jgi:hypothetical protein
MEDWTLLTPTKKSFINYLVYNPKNEDWFHMPNSIFEDLKTNEEIKSKNTSVHIAFAYSYYFLISWLWRYAKYGYIDHYNVEENKIYHAPLKKVYKLLLGVSVNSKQYDYIVKKNGVLAQLGYIAPYKYAPVGIKFFDPNGKYDNFTHLINGYDKYESTYLDAYLMENKFIEGIRINRKSNLVDFPIRGFYSTLEDQEEGIENGTFIDSANTHKVRMEAFLKCMQNKDLGLLGFYLWSYLCYRTDQFRTGFSASRGRLIGETRIKQRKLNQVLSALEREGMIKVKHEDYVVVREEKIDSEINDKKESYKQDAKDQKFKQFESNTYWGIRDNWETPEFIKKGKPISLEEYQQRHSMDLDDIEDDLYPFSNYAV